MNWALLGQFWVLQSDFEYFRIGLVWRGSEVILGNYWDDFEHLWVIWGVLGLILGEFGVDCRWSRIILGWFWGNFGCLGGKLRWIWGGFEGIPDIYVVILGGLGVILTFWVDFWCHCWCFGEIWDIWGVLVSDRAVCKILGVILGFFCSNFCDFWV